MAYHWLGTDYSTLEEVRNAVEIELNEYLADIMSDEEYDEGDERAGIESGELVYDRAGNAVREVEVTVRLVKH